LVTANPLHCRKEIPTKRQSIKESSRDVPRPAHFSVNELYKPNRGFVFLSFNKVNPDSEEKARRSLMCLEEEGRYASKNKGSFSNISDSRLTLSSLELLKSLCLHGRNSSLMKKLRIVLVSLKKKDEE
jgi:hypothetical protein